VFPTFEIDGLSDGDKLSQEQANCHWHAVKEAADMTLPADPERYKNHRFPGALISHGVWLYYRFPLNYRNVQELLCELGIDVTYEAIRQWCLKLG
jgi:hypothetical protein